MAVLSKSIDIYDTISFLFLSDFSAGLEDASIKILSLAYSLTSMINKPTYYKNPKKTILYWSNSDKLSAFFLKFLCYRDRLIRFS